MVGYGIKGSLRACFIHQNYAIGVLQSFIYHHSLTKFLIFKGVPEMHFDNRHIQEYSRRITRRLFQVFVSTIDTLLLDVYSNGWFVK